MIGSDRGSDTKKEKSAASTQSTLSRSIAYGCVCVCVLTQSYTIFLLSEHSRIIYTQHLIYLSFF